MAKTNGLVRLPILAMLAVLALLAALWVAYPASAAKQQWSAGNTNITSISASQDGKQLAVSTYNATVEGFSTEGEHLYTFEMRNVATGVAYLADGRLLASSDDRNLYLLDEQGNEIWRSNLKRQVTSISASDDGSYILALVKGATAAYSMDGNGEITAEINIGIQPRKAAVSANGEWAAIGGSDQYIYLLNKQHETVGKFPVSGTIDALAVDNEGKVAVGTTSRTVYIYGSNGNLVAEVRTADAVTAVDADGSGNYYAAADFGGNYYLLDAEGSILWRGKGNGAGRAVELTADGSAMYTGSSTGDIQYFNTESVISAAKQKAMQSTILLIVAIVLGLGIVLGILRYMHRRQKLGVFRAMWRERYTYMMLVPSFALILLFLYYPAFSGLFHSFYDWKPGAKTTFVGLANYERMLNDPYVKMGIGNLLLLMVTGLVKTVGPPLLVAELIYYLRSKKSQYWFRTAFVTSMIIPAVAGLLIWQNLYDPNVGLVNKTLEAIGLGHLAHSWLGDPNTAIWAIIFMGFPFISILSLLVFYAGLIAIPQDMIESAKIDGASTWRIIRSLHLPMLSGQMKLLIILSFIGIMQDFGSILIVTGGGPLDSTYVPALQMYYAATQFNDLGYASAIGVSMFVFILALTIINMKFIKTEHD